MAEPQPNNRRHSRAAVIRSIVLIVLLGVVGFFVWRHYTHREGYTGGDVTTTGTIEAEHVDLAFKVPGRIAVMNVSEGDAVHAGQLVGQLETQDLDGQVMTAEAGLEAAKAALAQAQASQQKSVRDLARQRELLAADATTQQAYDATKAAVQVGAAQVQSGLAQVHQAESALAQAKLQRSYAELHSSDAGQVSQRIHLPGEIVIAGAPVLTISHVDTVKVLAPVDETRVGAVRVGDKVRVKVYTFDRRFFDGQVSDVQPAGDFATRKDWGAQRRDIRTFTVTARLPNPDHLLKDGMTAEVTIQVAPPAPLSEASK
jgi:RND family efflux transporter MFP subunit